MCDHVIPTFYVATNAETICQGLSLRINAKCYSAGCRLYLGGCPPTML